MVLTGDVADNANDRDDHDDYEGILIAVTFRLFVILSPSLLRASTFSQTLWHEIIIRKLRSTKKGISPLVQFLSILVPSRLAYFRPFHVFE